MSGSEPEQASAVSDSDTAIPRPKKQRTNVFDFKKCVTCARVVVLRICNYTDMQRDTLLCELLIWGGTIMDLPFKSQLHTQLR